MSDCEVFSFLSVKGTWRTELSSESRPTSWSSTQPGPTRQSTAARWPPSTIRGTLMRFWLALQSEVQWQSHSWSPYRRTTEPFSTSLSTYKASSCLLFSDRRGVSTPNAAGHQYTIVKCMTVRVAIFCSVIFTFCVTQLMPQLQYFPCFLPATVNNITHACPALSGLLGVAGLFPSCLVVKAGWPWGNKLLVHCGDQTTHTHTNRQFGIVVQYYLTWSCRSWNQFVLSAPSWWVNNGKSFFCLVTVQSTLQSSELFGGWQTFFFLYLSSTMSCKKWKQHGVLKIYHKQNMRFYCQSKMRASNKISVFAVPQYLARDWSGCKLFLTSNIISSKFSGLDEKFNGQHNGPWAVVCSCLCIIIKSNQMSYSIHVPPAVQSHACSPHCLI